MKACRSLAAERVHTSMCTRPCAHVHVHAFTHDLRRCDCSEPFLASRVPYLKFHFLAICLDRSDFEINSDCGDVAARERVVSEAQQQTTLSDACE